MAHEPSTAEGLGGRPQFVSGMTEDAFEEPDDHEIVRSVQSIIPPSSSIAGEQEEPAEYKMATHPPPFSTDETWTPSPSTSSSAPKGFDLDDISLDYQARYLVEQMAKFHPLDRKVWYRRDHYNPSSPTNLSNEAVYSCTSSNTSPGSTSPRTPVVHVTSPSQSTTPKPFERQPPASVQQRRRSDGGRDRGQRDVSRLRAQSVGARPKGVHFADDALVPKSNTRVGRTMIGVANDPVYVDMTIWGELYKDDGQATKRWKRWLGDMALNLVSNPGPQGYITPSALLNFYTDLARQSDETPFKHIFGVSDQRGYDKIRDLYDALKVEYKEYKIRGQKTPCLSRDGFIKWMIFHISAYPKQETKRLAAMAETKRFCARVHSPTGEWLLIPSTFSTSLIPAKAVEKAEATKKIKSLVRQLWDQPRRASASSRPVLVVQPSPEIDPRYRDRDQRYSQERLFVEVPRSSRSRRDHEREPQYYQDRERRPSDHRDGPSYRAYTYQEVSPSRRNQGSSDRVRRGENNPVQEPALRRVYTEFVPTSRYALGQRRYSTRDDRPLDSYASRRSSRDANDQNDYPPWHPDYDNGRYRRRDSEEDWTTSSPSGSSINGSYIPRRHSREPSWEEYA